MFAGFENMVKGKIDSIKQATTTTDLTRTPQTYQIKGRTIKELKLLSEGSFGFIWLAEDVTTKQKFALKRLVCINNSRFLQAKNQLELMMKFPKCKNIVGCEGGQLVSLKNGDSQLKVFVILMEYCPNGTLFDLLTARQNKGFSEKELLTIVYSMLEGLRQIHKIGVYHQDVKIENVLVGEDKAFKLCDFGSCSNRFIDLKGISKTQYGSIKEEIEAVTTPMYRPPEVVDPYLQYEIGYKVDLWMVGCVLYTLAYFTHPFVDSSAVGIASAVYRFPKYPKQAQYEVSQKIKDLIRNLLTPNPAYRPSVEEVLKIINNWYSVDQVPLNSEAKIRKSEEKEKEKEYQILNRKVVDFDGDVPMDQLLQIQQRLKNKANHEEIETKSFITTKKTGKNANQEKLSFANGPSSQNQFFQQSKPQQPVQTIQTSKQKQETISGNSFWTTGAANPASSNPKPSSHKQVAFNDFFAAPNSKPSQPPTQPDKQGDMYDFFFPAGESKSSAKPQQSKKKEVNLLDL